MCKKCFYLLFLLLSYSSMAFASGYQEISAPEVKDLLDKGNAKVIHVLSCIEYDMQHIPGSINIPVIHLKSSKLLSGDKNTPLVFYCMGHR